LRKHAKTTQQKSREHGLKKHEKTQKQLNGLREYFNKLQNETMETIKKIRGKGRTGSAWK
jgi:hypothetical protein